MKLAGEHRFDSPREQVWQALLDAEVLSRCLPGFERLELVGENEYEGALNLRVGPVQGKFQGKLTLSGLRPPEGYELVMKGQGPAGFIDGRGSLGLVEEGSGTTLSYDVDTQVGGKIAGVGQRLLESSARALSEQALGELGKQIAARASAAADGAPAELPEAPTEREFATEVAKTVARDLVPPARRPLLVGVLLALAAILSVVMLKSC